LELLVALAIVSNFLKIFDYHFLLRAWHPTQANKIPK